MSIGSSEGEAKQSKFSEYIGSCTTVIRATVEGNVFAESRGIPSAGLGMLLRRVDNDSPYSFVSQILSALHLRQTGNRRWYQRRLQELYTRSSRTLTSHSTTTCRRRRRRMIRLRFTSRRAWFGGNVVDDVTSIHLRHMTSRFVHICTNHRHQNSNQLSGSPINLRSPRQSEPLSPPCIVFITIPGFTISFGARCVSGDSHTSTSLHHTHSHGP